MKFFEAFANIFRVPDLRKRLLFTLGLLAVYRLGSQVPTPGIDINKWSQFFEAQSGSIFGFFDMFAGGNIRFIRSEADVPGNLIRFPRNHFIADY